MNSNYCKGRNKEYAVIKQLKTEGFTIAQRSAGSHSPIDIFAINNDTKTILFIQCKAGITEEREKAKAYKENEWINKGEWNVRFEVR